MTTLHGDDDERRDGRVCPPAIDLESVFSIPPRRAVESGFRFREGLACGGVAADA